MAHVVPVLHDRLEYADAVRRRLETLDPDAVAVEIPSSLERPWLRAVGRLPKISILLYETAQAHTVSLVVHPGDAMAEAGRWAVAHGRPLRCADLDVDGYADHRDAVPDSYAVFRLGTEVVEHAFHAQPRPRDRHDDAREAAMAFHVQQLRRAGAVRPAVVCGMHHADPLGRQLRRTQAQPLTPPERRNVRLLHLHPESLAEMLADPPFYVAAYEALRSGVEPPTEDVPPAPRAREYGPFRVLDGGGRDAGSVASRTAASVARAAHACGRPLDRLRLQWFLLREAERFLAAAAPDESVHPWQWRNLARFSRNLALVADRLVVDLFDLLVAARGCVSENFAWELLRLGSAYPAQSESATDLPVARVRADELWDGVRRLRLRQQRRRAKRPDWRSLRLRGRRGERWAGEFLEGFGGESICSYPPEDIRIEDFGRYLRRRGKSILSEEQARTLPFTTSVLDGIDVRETIRNWHAGRIMVRELGRVPGDVGSVIVIFEDEPFDGKGFPYMQTWHGEHDQESDMAFYCTDPAQGVVGPGICRATYGGLALSFPPRRMADVWSDPDYRFAESKAETLLLAALDYCVERMVVYVAAEPPRSTMRQIAARVGLKIVYVPIGTLSHGTLRRIRVLHILSGQEKRRTAREFIW